MSFAKYILPALAASQVAFAASCKSKSSEPLRHDAKQHDQYEPW